MRLNHDCVRDLLLTIESSEKQDYLHFEEIKDSPLMKSYQSDEIIYCFKKLLEKKFVNGQSFKGDGVTFGFVVADLTWDGHEFLDNIRDNHVWKETKAISSKVASASLSVLADVAKGYISRTLGL